MACSCADLRDGIAGKDDGEADEMKSKDNRALVDNNTAQTLSAEDISKMRTYLLTPLDSAEFALPKFFL